MVVHLIVIKIQDAVSGNIMCETHPPVRRIEMQGKRRVEIQQFQLGRTDKGFF